MDGSVVRTFAALQEDPSSVLNIYMGQPIATQLQGIQHPLVPSGWRMRTHTPPTPRHAHHTHRHMRTRTCTHTHTHMRTRTCTHTHTHHTVMMSLKQCRNSLTMHSFSLWHSSLASFEALPTYSSCRTCQVLEVAPPHWPCPFHCVHTRCREPGPVCNGLGACPSHRAVHFGFLPLECIL